MARDRPFNLGGGGYGFLLRSKIFSPQNLTLGYMTETLNQIIFFFLHQKSEYFFQQYSFLEKKHNPPGSKMVRPLQQNQSCKWNTTKKLHQLLLVWCMCVLAVL